MGDSFWLLVAGGDEGDQKRLILQPKPMRGNPGRHALNEI